MHCCNILNRSKELDCITASYIAHPIWNMCYRTRPHCAKPALSQVTRSPRSLPSSAVGIMQCNAISKQVQVNVFGHILWLISLVEKGQSRKPLKCCIWWITRSVQCRFRLIQFEEFYLSDITKLEHETKDALKFFFCCLHMWYCLIHLFIVILHILFHCSESRGRLRGRHPRRITQDLVTDNRKHTQRKLAHVGNFLIVSIFINHFTKDMYINKLNGCSRLECFPWHV